LVLGVVRKLNVAALIDTFCPIAVHLSVFEPGGQVLGNPSPPLSLSFVTEPTSSGCPEKP
jgi:hypothetical protein